MSAYRWTYLTYAVLALVNILLRIRGVMNGDSSDVVFLVLWGISLLIALCFAFDKEQEAKFTAAAARNKTASKQLFGRWYLLAEYAGLAPLCGSIFLLLVQPIPWVAVGVLFVLGAVYTIAICIAISRRAKRNLH